MTETSGFPEALKADNYKWFWESFDALPKVYPEVFEIKKTEKLYEKSTSAVGTGLLEETAENANYPEKSPMEGFVVYSKVRKWGKIEHVSKELHDDVTKLGNFLKSQMPIWTKDAVETMETFYANIFNYGGYTSGHSIFNASIPNVVSDASGDKIYDSSPLFAENGTYHTSKGGGTYYNGLGALNISKSNLQDAYTRMTFYNNRKEDDTKMRMVPDILLASPALKFTVDELVKSPDDPTTSNRAVNVLHGVVRPIYWPYLDDADQWTLLKARFGMKALMRENPHFAFEEKFESETYKMRISTRFGAEINNWRGSISANYATS